MDRTDAAHVIDKARSADVPVVFFNREPVQEDLQTWDRVYYVGSDARQSAQLQAQIVLDKWEEDPASLDLNGDGVLQYLSLIHISMTITGSCAATACGRQLCSGRRRAGSRCI